MLNRSDTGVTKKTDDHVPGAASKFQLRFAIEVAIEYDSSSSGGAARQCGTHKKGRKRESQRIDL